MQYKVVFTDLDGTLLSQKKDISSYSEELLKRLQKKVPVVLVSARMPKSMKYIQHQINGREQPLICYNGALIIHQNSIISSKTISPEIAGNIYRNALSQQVKLGLYHQDNWYAELATGRIEKEIFNTKTTPELTALEPILEKHQHSNTGFHKIMSMGPKNQLDTFYEWLTVHFSDALQIYRSNDTVIEISPKSASKLMGIKIVLHEIFKVPLSSAIAFGDNYNDIEMIANVGHGVAVANARPEVKQVANAIAADYSQDGVTKYLKQLFNL